MRQFAGLFRHRVRREYEETVGQGTRTVDALLTIEVGRGSVYAGFRVAMPFSVVRW